jgi:N-acetylglucosaminyldiphosphoundecaprenol N-acetyl-beta-D-mannosaminyltransferase
MFEISQLATVVRNAGAGESRAPEAAHEACALRQDSLCHKFLKRGMDVLAAAGLLIGLAPLVLARAIAARQMPRLLRETRLTIGARPFELRTLVFTPRREESDGESKLDDGIVGLHLYSTLLSVLTGKQSIVGPRPLTPHAAITALERSQRRLSIRPGLVSAWSVRRRANLDHATEAEVEDEYLEQRSLKGDCGILLRAFLLSAWRKPESGWSQEIDVCGFRVRNTTMQDGVVDLLERLGSPEPSHVAFLNAHYANVASGNAEYREALKAADVRWPDGMGVRLAGTLLKRPIQANINGTDLFPLLCRALRRSGSRIYLLGARPGVAEAVRDWIEREHPGVTVCGCMHGYFRKHEEPAVIQAIRESRADLILVALGAPRQDIWLQRWLVHSGARVGISVGGLFDFFGGQVPRAPLWLRELGFEWAYRLWQEPRRMWRRYLIGNVAFLARVIRSAWFASNRVPVPFVRSV